MALQRWTFDVFARRDGWVEIDFAATVLMTAVPVAQRVHIDIHFAPKPPLGRDMDGILGEAAAHRAEIVVISKPRRT
jgi:hypothetical protein